MAFLAEILLSSQIVYIAIGVVLGVFVGAIPGINGGMLMILTLPLTFYMASSDAMVLLVGMYVGGVTGGLVSAILLNIPGSPSSLVTAFDGWPMAKAGKASRAFALAISASFLGGMIAWVFLFTLSPFITKVALRFSSFDYFAFVVMGLAFIVTISGTSILRGLMSASLGMIVALPGVDEVTGRARLTFGSDAMMSGLDQLAVLIGVFAGSQLLSQALDLGNRKEAGMKLKVTIREIMRDILPLRLHAVNVFRSGVIGTWVGILPGIGASVGSLVSYSFAQSFSKSPADFGRGTEEGVVASEAANNATIGGALIPLITIGIPGSIGDAILISALIIHNVQVGPLLFQNAPDVYYAILGSAFWSNFVVFASVIIFVPLLSRVVDMPRQLLIPVLWLFCVIGAFATTNSFYPVWIMLVFSVIGIALELARFPLGPFIIGLILAPIAEKTLRSGLMASNGSYEPLFQSPVATPVLLLSLVIVIGTLVKRLREKRSGVSADSL